MTRPEYCELLAGGSLPGRSLEHALSVLATATSATTAVFDATGDLVAGPMPGSRLIAELLSCDAGREMVVAAHAAALDIEVATRHGNATPLIDGGILSLCGLDHFAIPIIQADRRLGTLTIGDRPRHPLNGDLSERVAQATGLDPEKLRQWVAELPTWNAEVAAAAREMAALLADLFAQLCGQEQELRRRIEELTAVYNLAGMLTDTLDLQQILNRAAVMVCEVMKVKACSIRLLEEESGNLVIKAVHNLSPEYLGKGPVNVSENPIDRAALNNEIVRIANVPEDPRTRYPTQAREEGIVSGMVCGMVYRGKAVGVMRVYTGEPYVFSTFEESLLRATSSQVAAAVVHARLLVDRLDSERRARQMAYAGEVQRRMIPASPPQNDLTEIGAVYRPTFEVGGDFYDFIQLPKKNLGLVVADVSGKGVPASLLMASLRSALRVYAYHMYDIDRILAEVNRYTCSETTEREFVTLFYGVLAPNRRLTYCNAGHPPPMLLREGEIQYLRTGGMVLGVSNETVYDREFIDLRRGDALLLYTDGATEAFNFNDEPFGQTRLENAFRQHAANPAQIAAQNVLWDIRRFRGLADRTDDVTLVVVKIR